jgi:hypothetical protein
MGRSSFTPAVAVTPEEIQSLLFDTRIMHRLQATAEADGQPADDLIDGDPNTYWLSDPANAQPHEITIHFPHPEPISGLVLMPRQNHREHQGDIREYRLDRSDDGTHWSEITQGSLPSSFDPHPIEFGQTLTVRHLKLTALAGFGTDTNTALAEVAVIYAGPKLAADNGQIEYHNIRTASPDIDAGGSNPAKPKP